jgi:catechol 2,3-dioxygenase-like lactoylglutathione lyase family enzyme
MTTTIPAGGRLQLALRVSDLDAAVGFYSRLFSAEPAKTRDGYANFALDAPPLKLVLIEGEGGGGLDHLGVEVGTTDEVGAAADRLRDAGLATFAEDDVSCCYARQDKVWVTGPDGESWEVYTVLGDADRMESDASAFDEAGACACGIPGAASPEPEAACCAAV